MVKNNSQSEFQIETKILMWLNAQRGCFAFKVDRDGYWDAKRGFYRKRKSAFSVPGTPDIVGCLYGSFFAIEVKKPGGKVSDEQKNWMRVAGEKSGAPSAVACSLEDAISFFLSLSEKTFSAPPLDAS